MLKFNMRQQEIEFFWPLTEQTYLDLDFTPCDEYAAEKKRQLYANSVLSIGSGIGTSVTSWSVPDISLKQLTEFRPNPESAGYWLVSPELKYYVSKEPNWFVKKMTKFMLGWEWGKN